MGDQNQSLTVKVEAKGVGDLGKPFKDLKAGAEKADLSLKDYGKSVGKFKKDLGSLQGGLLGLSTSVDLLPKGVGKAVLSLNALGSAAAALKGAGGLAATVGGSTVLGGIAAGVLALGSAAVIASPKLQDALGKSLLSVTGQAEQMEAALKRAQDRLDEIRSARSLGVGTEKEEAAFALRQAVSGPRREQQRALGLEKVRQVARAGALEQIPDTETDIFGPQLADRLKPGKFLDNAATLKQAAIGPANVPAELLRQQAVAQAEQAELAKRDQAARAALADVQEREKLSQQFGTAGDRIKGIQKSLASVGGQRDQLNAPAFATAQGASVADKNIQLRNREKLNAKEAALQAELQEARAAQARAQAGLGGRKFTTEGETSSVIEQQEKAAAALRESNQKVLEIKQKIRQAEIDSLKTVQQQVAEQQKLAAAAVQEEEAKLKGLKSSLGLEDKESIREQLTIARKIAGGKNLSDDDIKAVRGQEIFRESLEKIGAQRTDQDKDRQELLRLLGADKKLQEAKQAQDELVKLDATVKHEIKLKVEANAGETAAEISKQVVPEIEKAIGDLSKNIEALIEVKVNAAIQKARTQERDARNAAGG